MNLNEMALSNDLKIIELEINHHKNIAGQSIWEIGRRLNHVKENDLAHGEFGKWLEKIELSQYVANQFMKIANELPKNGTSNNLGVNALYLIATLPEEERTKEHVTEKGETKNESPTIELLEQMMINHYNKKGHPIKLPEVVLSEELQKQLFQIMGG